MTTYGFKVLDGGKMPTKGTAESAAWDLYAAATVDVPANSPLPVKIPTNVAARFPPGHYGQIMPRSGLAANYGVTVLAGVIDNDFFPNGIVVLLRSTKDITIKAGDRCAQLLILSCHDTMPQFDGEGIEATHVGFGSTGK